MADSTVPMVLERVPPPKRILPMARPRNSVGSVGRRTKLDANFFHLNVKNAPSINQFDVDIQEVKIEANERNQFDSQNGPGIPRNTSGYELAGKDVASSGPIPINRRVFDRFLGTSTPKGLAKRMAFDGRKIAYATEDVPEAMLNVPYDMWVDDDGNEPQTVTRRTSRYRVTMKLTGSLSTGELLKAVRSTEHGAVAACIPTINALDVALSKGNISRFVEVGRTFYTSRDSRHLGGGCYAWRGFYQSIRATQNGLAVNIDESFTPFWDSCSLENLLKDIMASSSSQGGSGAPRGRGRGGGGGRGGRGGRGGHQGPPPSQQHSQNLPPAGHEAWVSMGKGIHGLRVRAEHTNITYRVFGFSRKPAGDIHFQDHATNQMVSVTQYFERTYNMRVRKPSYPCAKTHPSRDVFIPIEFLSVCSNQRRTRAMSPSQTSTMIRAAALRPDDRRQSALKSVQTANYNDDPTCRAFGLSVDRNLVSVEARILPTPTLQYAEHKMTASNGSWNMQSAKMKWGATLGSWAVIAVGRHSERDAREFLPSFMKIGRQNGINIVESNPALHIIGANRNSNIEAELMDVIDREFDKERSANRWRLQLVLVFKERQDTPVYNTVKRVCDLKRGVASQVLLTSKIRAQRGGKLDQYCANVWLKVNAKLGGHNVQVNTFDRGIPNPQFLNRPYIVLGADVTHPAPGGGGRPSVAAVVGSKDRYCMQFTGALRNQPSKQEIITDMGEMFVEVYRRWFANFNPRVHAQAIIMFRDGVSEGQFQQVLDVELPAIRHACSEIGFNPRITYIIVTKRHHTRFFGSRDTNRNDLDRSGNMVAGTVVDTGVTSSEVWDFYLNSHAGIQGTNRPSKYTVLHDENNFTADELQGYIFRLAHGFARCTRSVSMVNSAHYAHLLAFRGRVFLGDEGSDMASGVSGGSGQPVPVAEKAHQCIEDRLFFV